MPFEDTPSPPAQTHPVKLRPPSLQNLSIWTYLALAFVIISTIGVLCYAVYSCYYSVTLTRNALPQYYFKSPSKTKRPKKKAWRPSESGSSPQQPMLSEVFVEGDSTYQVDRMMSIAPLAHTSTDRAHIPPVAFPSVAVTFPPAKPRTVPTYDMHNIRFASPSDVAIYTNPKLEPVRGSAVPLSYDSRNNLFGNPFTPTTIPDRKIEPGKRSLSGFRVKGGGRSLQAGKENSKALSSQPVNCMY
ncbi:hypothetical protein B0H19DRAFT_1169872 [Mycena capillaripes]|nr:hypothetical protein B0H19DRAFT_1169872 [Mycena capillaripes]